MAQPYRVSQHRRRLDQGHRHYRLPGRPGRIVAPATAAQVDQEVADVIKAVRAELVPADGLALGDQMMAAYGPAMEVYGRYAKVLQPDGSEASLERYLTLARRSVREATALRLDEIPIETFDALTRFAVFWLRLYGRTVVPKGEARFLAQVDNLRLEDLRGGLLAESGSGFRLRLDPPGQYQPRQRRVRCRPRPGRRLHRRRDRGSRRRARQVADRPADDAHLWAVIGESGRPATAKRRIAKALTAVQRNASVIQNLAQGVADRARRGWS